MLRVDISSSRFHLWFFYLPSFILFTLPVLCITLTATVEGSVPEKHHPNTTHEVEIPQHELAAARIWYGIQRFEGNVHIASIYPKSGPTKGVTKVTLSGLGFVSAIDELSGFLKKEDFRFIGDRATSSALPDLRSLPSDSKSAPQFFIESIHADNTTDGDGRPRFFSTLVPPKIYVHVDIIDGLYLVTEPVEPSAVSDSLFTFLLDSESENLIQGIAPTPFAFGHTSELLDTTVDLSGPDSEDVQPKKSTPSQHLALVSVHLFPLPIYADKNPLIFKIYVPPNISHVFPSTLSLLGSEEIYLYGENLFASDVIKVRFSSKERSKIVDCEFVMAVSPNATVRVETKSPHRALLDSLVPLPVDGVPGNDSVIFQKEIPAILCRSPSWTIEEDVNVALSFNGQQYHQASSSDTSTPIVVVYHDASSLLGAVAKGVVEREREGGGNEDLSGGSPLNAGEVSGGSQDKDSFQVIRVVDEGPGGDQSAAGSAHQLAPSGNHSVEVEAASPEKPKHLPSFREKPKDLLAMHLEDAEANSYIISRPADVQDLRLDFRLIWDLTIMVVSTAIGGGIAELAQLPVVVGYLAGGAVVGPQCLDKVQQLIQISTISQLGSALLLFKLGLHFSVSKILKVTTAAFWGGCVAPVCFIILFVQFALIKSTSLGESVVLGCLLTMSSTVLCCRDMVARRATETHESELILGILLVQDVLLGLFVALIPAFSLGTSGRPVESAFGTVVRIILPLIHVGLLALAGLVLGVFVLPHTLPKLHAAISQEAFLLTCLSVVLTIGSFSEYLELSFELGAFVAGLMMTNLPTTTRNNVANTVKGLEDFFVALFFSAIGLGLDPYFIWDNMQEVVGLLLAFMLVKLIVYFSALILCRYDGLTSFRAAMMLSHVGEFGFVILGKARGNLLGRKVHLLLSGTTGISLLVTPFVLRFLWFVPGGRNMFSSPNVPPFFEVRRCCGDVAEKPLIRSLLNFLELITPAGEYTALDTVEMVSQNEGGEFQLQNVVVPISENSGDIVVASRQRGKDRNNLHE